LRTKEDVVMAWLNWLGVVLVIVGLGLFLYGANVYNATVGWAGFYLGIVGVLFCVVFYVYGQLNKKELGRFSV
jgi:membrane-bound ClpP family serine protease